MMNTTCYARKGQKPKMQWLRQTPEESYSSKTSPSKTTHRQTASSSFVRQLPDGSGVKSSPIKIIDPLTKSWVWVHSDSHALSQEHMVDCCSPESSKNERKFLGCEDDESLPELELIRELSFSPPPPHKTKQRADTACTETSSSSSETSAYPEEHRHNTSPIGLDLKHSQDLRKRPLSPLLGLQYLPDHGNILI
eukprot:scaffold7497_cov84-Skeletonema_dohrnii-CCMP3373.AAC.3